ncbi:MAG: ferritin [Bacteroidetes bacterium]|nr:ferritin [Bacteroidota bacterium]
MISKKIEAALNKQVESEAISSQIYLAMASWVETQGLTGTCQFLYKHSDEERLHMLKLIRFLNERGRHGIVPQVKQPFKTFESLSAVFRQILEHEIHVTQEINNIISLCLQEKDYTTHNFMQYYVAEQIEEERVAKSILDKLNLIGDDKGGLYLFDRDMQNFPLQDGNQAEQGTKAG